MLRRAALTLSTSAMTPISRSPNARCALSDLEIRHIHDSRAILVRRKAPQWAGGTVARIGEGCKGGGSLSGSVAKIGCGRVIANVAASSGVDAEQAVDEGHFGAAAYQSIQNLNWPFLNIRIISKPLIVARAVRIDWKSSVGRIRRLIRYLACRCSSSGGMTPS